MEITKPLDFYALFNYSVKQLVFCLDMHEKN